MSGDAGATRFSKKRPPALPGDDRGPRDTRNRRGPSPPGQYPIRPFVQRRGRGCDEACSELAAFLGDAADVSPPPRRRVKFVGTQG